MPELAATASAPRRWKWPIRFVMVLAGLAVGLAIAEVVFHIRDDGAFPHLNCYVADDHLGVRLQPGASERISFGGNPVSSVRINADGYRGDDWPAPGSGEIVVVGDSQVFGLGVEEDETFSARLAARTQRAVLDAGVPTYGPGEYRAVIAELLAARHPSVVVLTINMVNDLFELSHPNTTRHTVWDGWAVRKENAPDSITEFPGRRWLFARSHLMFALRKWWGGADLAAGGVASEGTWRDLVSAGDTVAKQRDALRAKLAAPGASRLAADEEIARANRQLEEAYAQGMDNQNVPTVYFDGYFEAFHGGANVGDIVEDGFSESARSIVATSELIARGEAARRHMREQVEGWVKTHDSAKLHALITTRDAAVERRTEIDDQAKLAEAFEPPMLPYVRDVRALVEKAGARLVVVVLPIDVQVSDAEWAKYGAQPRDMAAARTLSEELTASIARLGVTAIDAQVALRAAEPGAFLDHDIHMTAKGHTAVGDVLADAIAAPPPSPPKPVLHVPLPSEWTDAAVLAITGDDTGCDARRVGDWLRVMCGRTDRRDVPTSIAVDDADALALVTPYQVSVVVHLDKAQTVAGSIGWAKQKRTIALSLDKGVVLGPLTGPRPPSSDDDYYPTQFPRHHFVSKPTRALCECWNREVGGATGDIDTPTCSGAYGVATDHCAHDYPNSCAQMIACSWREPGL